MESLFIFRNERLVLTNHVGVFNRILSAFRLKGDLNEVVTII